MRTFLNSFGNFVFCLKCHLQQFSPNENFKYSPVPPLFLHPPPLPLDFKKFQFPPDFIEFKNPVTPFTKGRGEPL